MTTITPETAGWTYSALRVLELDGPHTLAAFETGDFEMLVLPLAGSGTVTCDGETFELQGREDVFSRVTDFAYVPREATVTVTGKGRFAGPAGERAWLICDDPARGYEAPGRTSRWILGCP